MSAKAWTKIEGKIGIPYCTILSFAYGSTPPKDFPDPSYPYQTPGNLAYLSTTWFYIGIIVSATFISMFIIGDMFDYVAKAIKKRGQ